MTHPSAFPKLTVRFELPGQHGIDRAVSVDGPMPSQPEQDSRAKRVAALLEDNIRTELDVQLGGVQRALPEELVRRLAWGIAAEVLYSFDVDRKPDWVKPGGVHAWEESGGWFARCGVCLLDSPASPTRVEAAAWSRTHQESHADSGS